jgi:hypothetical protein
MTRANLDIKDAHSRKTKEEEKKSKALAELIEDL